MILTHQSVGSISTEMLSKLGLKLPEIKGVYLCKPGLFSQEPDILITREERFEPSQGEWLCHGFVVDGASGEFEYGPFGFDTHKTLRIW